MRHQITVLLLSICVVLSGCSTILDSDGHQTDLENSSTNSGLSGDAGSATNTDTNATNVSLTSEQREIVDHGKAFSRLVERILDRHSATEYISSTSYPNRSIRLTIQVEPDTPLYWSLMDTGQAVAAVTYFGTTENRSLPRENGKIARLHEPENIKINVLNPTGEYIGSFEVNPDRARAYRSNDRTAFQFSNDIISSYESEQFYERGSIKPSHYLNRSELSLWAQDYAREVRNWSRGSFDSKFPVENIRTNSRSYEVLHQFNWTRGEYGQVTDSAYATVYTAYWRTAGSSLAKPPENLYVYIERPGQEKNYAGHMSLYNASILLKSNLDPVNRSAYLNRAEGGFVETDENPYRDIFYSTSESNDTYD